MTKYFFFEVQADEQNKLEEDTLIAFWLVGRFSSVPVPILLSQKQDQVRQSYILTNAITLDHFCKVSIIHPRTPFVHHC